MKKSLIVSAHVLVLSREFPTGVQDQVTGVTCCQWQWKMWRVKN